MASRALRRWKGDRRRITRSLRVGEAVKRKLGYLIRARSSGLDWDFSARKVNL